MLKARCWNVQEQYLEFSTGIPASSALYGLGERSSSTGIELRRDGIPLALWNHDSPAAAPDQNVYGSHPILMEVREGADPVLGGLLPLLLLAFSAPFPALARHGAYVQLPGAGVPIQGLLIVEDLFRHCTGSYSACRTRFLPCSAVACRVRTPLSTAGCARHGV